MAQEPEPSEELMEQLRLAEEWRHAEFQRAITQAQATPEELHRILVLNLTTKPPVNYAQLVLSWMQRDPAKWAGYHPEQCAAVDQVRGDLS